MFIRKVFLINWAGRIGEENMKPKSYIKCFTVQYILHRDPSQVYVIK